MLALLRNALRRQFASTNATKKAPTGKVTSKATTTSTSTAAKDTKEAAGEQKVVKKPVSPEWQAYEEKVKAVRSQYLEETRHIPTKAQAEKQSRETNQKNRDAAWEAYLNELRPKLQAMPHGTLSIRASLRDLQKRRAPVVKTEERRQKALEKFINMRKNVVLEKRKKVLHWINTIKVIEPEDFEAAIQAAWEKPCERNQTIEDLIQQQIERQERLKKLHPHEDDLDKSILLKPKNN